MKADQPKQEAARSPLPLPSRMVRVFVVWHLFAMITFSLPAPPRVLLSGSIPFSVSSFASDPVSWMLLGCHSLKRSKWSPLYWYMVPTGLWQYWDMFAPNPSNMDVFLDGLVTFQDGSQKVQVYPRMSDMPYPEKYVKERFRKYIERVNPDVVDWKRPALAQWLALQAADSPQNPPVTVELRRHYRLIPRYGREPATQDTTESISVHQVDLKKLKRDKGW